MSTGSSQLASPFMREQVARFCDAAIRYCSARGAATAGPADDLRAISARAHVVLGTAGWSLAVRDLLSHRTPAVRLCSAEYLVRSATSSGIIDSEPAAVIELEAIQRGDDANLRLLATSALWFAGHGGSRLPRQGPESAGRETFVDHRVGSSVASPVRRADVYRFDTQYLIHASSLSTRGLWIASAPAFLLRAAADAGELGRCVELALAGSAVGVPHPEHPEDLMEPLSALDVDWDELGAPTACVEVEEDQGRVVLRPTRRLRGEGGFEPIPALAIVTGLADQLRLGGMVLKGLALCQVEA